ncbi:MAG TPA: DinB family protein, partial [Anaerolineaceae bacterium]
EWAVKRDYHSQSGPAALAEFIHHRMQLLQTLDGLSTEDWGLHGRHAIFGPTTLRELACFSAAHDRAHIQQAFQILKTFTLPSS